jgi:hypothetical protein
MFKNVASQKVALFAFDTTTGTPKTGDAANITPYVAKDYGTVTALGTATATEMDATNAKGWYSFTLAQAETNADALMFTAKSATANISIVGSLIFTTPPNFSSFLLNSSGQVDVIKINGTSQTARDIGASVLLSVGTGTGQVNLSSGAIPVTSSVKKNQALAGFPFIMTDSTNHNPATGKTVAAQRSLDGATFASCANSVTEVSNGLYKIDLAAGDLNGNTVDLRFTATGCDDLNIVIITQP